MTESFVEKFEKILGKSSIHKLQDVFVTVESKNKYRLFNKFIVEKISTHEILVQKIDSNINNSFSNLKNSVAWCVFYNHGQLYQSDRILELDRKLSGLELEIINQKRLFKKTKLVEDKLLFLDKLNENKLKKTIYSNQLEKLLQESSDYQRKKFDQKAKLQEKR